MNYLNTIKLFFYIAQLMIARRILRCFNLLIFILFQYFDIYLMHIILECNDCNVRIFKCITNDKFIE